MENWGSKRRCAAARVNRRRRTPLTLGSPRLTSSLEMSRPERTSILDARAWSRALQRMAVAVIERAHGTDALVLIGIQRRGVELAERIAKLIEQQEGVLVPRGALDITLYRDDLQTVGPKPVIGETRLPGDLTGKHAVVVDDVLYTGRTVRAALDELADFGRPKRISLCVLVDRGGRELPIRAAVVGKVVQKGETLVDTAKNLEAMRIDMVVIRHASSGAAQFLGDRIRSNVVNAGDGKHEHPTQALLDLLTIRDKLGRIEGVKVCLVGDILHSRVARSNIWGLTKLGAQVAVCGPHSLMPRGIADLGVTVLRRVEEAIEWADVLNVLRLQLERMEAGFIPSLREYYRVFGVTVERLAKAPRALTVMHPGPMNRGVEIDSRVADGPHSVILDQVTNGVAVRMAVLYLLAGGKPELADAAKGPAAGGTD